MLEKVFEKIKNKFKKTPPLTVTLETINGMKFNHKESESNKLTSWLGVLRNDSKLVKNDFIFWALHSERQDICVNADLLIKWRGKVYMHWEWDDLIYTDDGTALPTGSPEEYPLTIEHFVKMCQDWVKVYEDYYLIDKIIVREEQDGSISFEPIYYKNQSMKNEG